MPLRRVHDLRLPRMLRSAVARRHAEVGPSGQRGAVDRTACTLPTVRAGRSEVDHLPSVMPGGEMSQSLLVTIVLVLAIVALVLFIFRR